MTDGVDFATALQEGFLLLTIARLWSRLALCFSRMVGSMRSSGPSRLCLGLLLWALAYWLHRRRWFLKV